MRKYCIVPEEDIKKAEEDRIKIHKYVAYLEEKLPDASIKQPVLTVDIYRLTHRRYTWFNWFG